MVGDHVLIRTREPGDAGYVCYMHMKYYGERYGFKPVFEYYVMKGLAEFLRDPGESRLWIAEIDNSIIGSIAIVKTPRGAQLRWFLVDAEHQGNGIGRKLMNTAMQFCKERGYKHMFLWTTNILDAARHLYKEFGFKPVEENTNNEWTDGTIIEERWEFVSEE